MAADTSSWAAGSKAATGLAQTPLASLIDAPRLCKFVAAAAKRSGAATKYDIAETPVVHGRWFDARLGMYMSARRKHQI